MGLILHEGPMTVRAWLQVIVPTAWALAFFAVMTMVAPVDPLRGVALGALILLMPVLAGCLLVLWFNRHDLRRGPVLALWAFTLVLFSGMADLLKVGMAWPHLIL